MGEDGGGASDDYDPHGDPKADPRERRRIRYEYRQLIAETQSNNFSLIVSSLYFCYAPVFQLSNRILLCSCTFREVKYSKFPWSLLV